MLDDLDDIEEEEGLEDPFVDPLQTVFLASFMTTSEPSGRMTRQS
jgi:hypothetical protein